MSTEIAMGRVFDVEDDAKDVAWERTGKMLSMAVDSIKSVTENGKQIIPDAKMQHALRGYIIDDCEKAYYRLLTFLAMEMRGEAKFDRPKFWNDLALKTELIADEIMQTEICPECRKQCGDGECEDHGGVCRNCYKKQDARKVIRERIS